ncbi:insulin-degrading enzyme-like 1, peroxisomal [Eucalyptus grandis]|uniref:insulin-degrading enzyme-like 1, peroxisomal n=1 Tax=Eucalyptus grandis TaxID=71139 RepID=UPI00192E78BF|nr:insulin-degrading enzyme-like 1, peroxisomal [Eucalyptus grandis]
MTDVGHAEHTQDIMGLLFKYIDILHQSGVCEWIYDELEVSGYYHKLRVLLDTILKAMADFAVKPERFSVIKVTALRKLAKQELIAFFNKHIRIGAPKRKVLSVRVYGSKHSSNFEVDNNKAVGPNTVRIDDIFSFRASQPLYGSH